MTRRGQGRRRTARRTRPVLHVRIADRIYRTVDWSRFDLAVRGGHGVHELYRAGNVVTAYFGLAADEIAFRFEGMVVRTDAISQVVAFSFLHVPPETKTMLDGLTRMARGVSPSQVGTGWRPTRAEKRAVFLARLRRRRNRAAESDGDAPTPSG